jgi:Ser-tRNA(Ala) deacylase AlaX
MTRKLYYEDVYLKEFDARVIAIDGNKIVLDQTAFYAQGGGQVGDSGEINGIRVVDTKKDNGDVRHFLEREPDFKVGDTVHGNIDWQRRYKVMRTHSATHIVFCFMQEVFPGVQNASPGIVDDRKDKMDYFMSEKPSEEKLKEVEDKANSFIAEGHDIRIAVEPDGTRHWLSGKFDIKCGGTHPRNTSEVGKVKVERGKKPGAGKERIEVSLT